MMASDLKPVADSELVCRRIPPNLPWFEPPDKVTSANFRLDTRVNEQGLSVYRSAIVSDGQILSKPDAIPGSFVVKAAVGSIRGLKNGKDEPLGLDVIRVGDVDDPGHAEIRGPEPGKLSSAVSKALQRLFKRDL
jgi:hypothetical protein